MTGDIIKALLESLTDEQKQEIIENISSQLSIKDIKPKLEEDKQLVKETDLDSTESKEDFTMSKHSKKLQRGKEPVKFKKNQWVDDGEFQLEGEKEWSESRRKTDRRRPKAKKVELECSVCGRSFMSHPAHVYGEYHRCNRCGGN